jgi:hypothetical protein
LCLCVKSCSTTKTNLLYCFFLLSKNVNRKAFFNAAATMTTSKWEEGE